MWFWCFYFIYTGPCIPGSSTVRRRSSRTEIQTDNAISIPRRRYPWKRWPHGWWDQATGPTHEGMLQAVRSRAVRHDDRPAWPEGSPAEGRGDLRPWCTGVWRGPSTRLNNDGLREAHLVSITLYDVIQSHHFVPYQSWVMMNQARTHAPSKVFSCSLEQNVLRDVLWFDVGGFDMILVGIISFFFSFPLFCSKAPPTIEIGQSNKHFYAIYITSLSF